MRLFGVCGGAGADFIPDAAARGCDAYITADVKHHQFLWADELGISLVDAGHFSTENVVVPVLAGWLRGRIPRAGGQNCGRAAYSRRSSSLDLNNS